MLRKPLSAFPGAQPPLAHLWAAQTAQGVIGVKKKGEPVGEGLPLLPRAALACRWALAGLSPGSETAPASLWPRQLCWCSPDNDSAFHARLTWAGFHSCRSLAELKGLAAWVINCQEFERSWSSLFYCVPKTLFKVSDLKMQQKRKFLWSSLAPFSESFNAKKIFCWCLPSS